MQLNHEYVYNEGDWTYHKIGYAVILGVRYKSSKACDILVGVVWQLLKQKYL